MKLAVKFEKLEAEIDLSFGLSAWLDNAARAYEGYRALMQEDRQREETLEALWGDRAERERAHTRVVAAARLYVEQPCDAGLVALRKCLSLVPR